MQAPLPPRPNPAASQPRPRPPVDAPPELAALRVEQTRLDVLPLDPSEAPQPRQVHGAVASRVTPRTASAPRLVAFSREVAQSLGLSESTCRDPEFAQVVAGNRLLPGMLPHADCYGGHQFGNWAGQLGDGRALHLGEVVGPDGVRRTLQLKGAGPTPYSRSGDGLAVLRSSVREFLCSEAMHHLGVPTTRALSLVTTGDEVLRDMFYDGRPALEPGAVVCRVAESFTRFGTFELPASRGDLGLLRALVAHTLGASYPALCDGTRPAPDQLTDELVGSLFAEVCERSLDLVVHWMRVGFVHGVLNTDNMSILGQTIDYGPYGWLEGYEPGWTPNTTDAAGRRYAFGRQPQVVHWNLLQLGNALAAIVEDPAVLQAPLDAYAPGYEARWGRMMAGKLGLAQWTPETDEPLALELLEVLQATETDMTLFFRGLGRVSLASGDLESTGLPAALEEAYYLDEPPAEARDRLGAWLRTYAARLRQDALPDDERRARMEAVNPRYVLRNYLAQLAIDRATEGDLSAVEELLEVLRRPYDEAPQHAHHAAKRPEWARTRAGCSMLSCSS